MEVEPALQYAGGEVMTETILVGVDGSCLVGDPCAVLVAQSASAVLAVVGHRGCGGFGGLMLGSVAAKLAAHASCPVVVASGTCASDGAVVVGVDGSAAGWAAAGFAFEEAELRRAPVRAVHAAVAPPAAGPGALLCGDLRCEEARVAKLVADAIDEQHPDVLARHEIRWAPVAASLIDASRGAQLIVVGVRGTSGLAGSRLGATSYALLHHAACPVAVVPAAR